MKKLALVVVLLFSALAWAGKDPIPAEYRLNVHVASSCLIEGGWSRLTVIIDGKKYELQGNPTVALLAPGDYKAKLVKDEHKTSYDFLSGLRVPVPRHENQAVPSSRRNRVTSQARLGRSDYS